MGIELTPEQEALAREAVNAGHFATVEEFIQAAFHTLHADLQVCAEEHLELTTDELRAEIQKGLKSGDARQWEGAQAFNARMRAAHANDLDGNGR